MLETSTKKRLTTLTNFTDENKPEFHRVRAHIRQLLKLKRRAMYQVRKFFRGVKTVRKGESLGKTKANRRINNDRNGHYRKMEGVISAVFKY